LEGNGLSSGQIGEITTLVSGQHHQVKQTPTNINNKQTNTKITNKHKQT